LNVSLNSSNIFLGISEHNGVLLEVEWDEICSEPKVERIIPLYQKTDILDMKVFLRDNFNLWARKSSCAEEIWKKIKVIILEGFERYVPQEILSKNANSEQYNKEVKRKK
jgi:hypothetical protein